MITETPDLQKALDQFMAKLKENVFAGDKGAPIPEIRSARIAPILYESMYKKEK